MQIKLILKLLKQVEQLVALGPLSERFGIKGLYCEEKAKTIPDLVNRTLVNFRDLKEIQ